MSWELFIDVSVGESVRIIRDLQGMSQNKLADASGIPQSAISAIENDRINLGVELTTYCPDTFPYMN